VDIGSPLFNALAGLATCLTMQCAAICAAPTGHC
jgi:hypothetical protein